tara:strand:+ start:111 stop:458 length:348 start_codon:yes stop_codon:yes gene_type:complete
MKTSDFMKGVKKASESLNEDLTLVTYDGESTVSIKGIRHNQREYEKVMDKFRKEIARKLRVKPKDLEDLEDDHDGPHFNLAAREGNADEEYNNVNQFIKDESPMSIDDYKDQMNN